MKKEELNVAISPEIMMKIRQILGTTKAVIDLEQENVIVPNDWEIQKMAEKAEILAVNGFKYEPLIKKEKLTPELWEKMEKLYDDELCVGKIIRTHVGCYDSEYIVLRIISENKCILGNIAFSNKETLDTSEICLNENDFLLRGLKEKYKTICVRNCMISVNARDCEILGQVFNIEKIMPIIEMANNWKDC